MSRPFGPAVPASHADPRYAAAALNRFLLINAYSARNAGDAAIVLATADLIETLTGEKLAIATRTRAEDRAFYSRYGIDATDAPIPFPVRRSRSEPVRGAVLAAGIFITTLLTLIWRVFPRLAERLARLIGLTGLLALWRAERVIICGGGYLYTARRRLNFTLVHLALQVRLATIAGKRPVMMPQSIGPLDNGFDRWLVTHGFARVTSIVGRDRQSIDEAERLFGAERTRLLCPDVALRPWSRPPAPEIVKRRGNRRIGIVVMDWTWARRIDRTAAMSAYVAKLATVARTLLEQDHYVAVFGHSHVPEHGQDDLMVARSVVAAVPEMFRDRINVAEDGTDPDRLRQMFSGLDLVIGTRLHSCILALIEHTPAIALAYQPKTLGTYELLGLRSLCFDVEEFEAVELLKTVDHAFSRLDGLTEQIRAAQSNAEASVVATYQALL